MSGHATLLARLLPPVSYAPAAGNLAVSLEVEGRELDRVMEDAPKALGPLQPFTYREWLEDWERVYGLPGECSRGGQSMQDRIKLLALAFTERGGISLAWLKRYAALVGYEIDIREYVPFRAGKSRAGEALTNGDWIYALTIYAISERPREFRAGRSRAGDPLRVWGDPLLECIINKYNPAHAVAHVAYITEG